jgi:hypothetical protein
MTAVILSMAAEQIIKMNKHTAICAISGHLLYIDEIWQTQTYGGILVGKPDADRIIERTMVLIHEKLPGGSKTAHLLSPQTKSEQRPKFDMENISIKVLPPITCGAIISSLEPARNRQADMSFLTLLWFQDDWAFPICKKALMQISQLNWSKLAEDGIF